MQDLVKQVSRSFYLTLRILPRSIRPQLSLAYLLARASDTIADTDLIEARRRLEALRRFRSCIREACDGQKPGLPALGDLAEAQTAGGGKGTPAERTLLQGIESLLESLRRFAAADRLLIGSVLETITRGQETDLTRFRDAAADRIAALDTDADLDAYTYAVAGCVGEFWTHMCRAHVFPRAALDDAALLADGVRFGKGLQLVNILRDLPRDLRQGRCYIPRDRLSGCGFEPRDLLDAARMDRFRPLYSLYLSQAEDCLQAGWRYTTGLPYRCVRVRLACAWPILIGIRTIRELRNGNVLDAGRHVRIRQADTWSILRRTILYYAWPAKWNGLYELYDRGESGRGRTD